MKPSVEISEAIERELLSWPDVTVGQHRFGGREFRVGKLELGHLHGSAVADLPFPRAIRDELIAGGKVSPHHHVPNPAFATGGGAKAQGVGNSPSHQKGLHQNQLLLNPAALPL